MKGLSNTVEQSSFLSKDTIVLGIAVLLLVGSFMWNAFFLVPQEWFDDFQRDSEALVISRLVQSEARGVFDQAGMLSLYRGDSKLSDSQIAIREYSQAYPNEVPVYKPYTSQIGLQGIILSVLAKVLPFSAAVKLELFWLVNVVLLAVVCISIVYWFYREWGITVAGVVFATFLFSPWLTVMARNLYWVWWGYYLPFIVGLMVLAYEERTGKYYSGWIECLLFITILLKCSNGYEFISTVLLSMMVPLVYYGVANQWSWRLFLHRAIVWGSSGIAAFFTCLAIHAWQLSSLYGTWWSGLLAIFQNAGRRTAGNATLYDSSVRDSLLASNSEVVLKYLISFALVWIIALAIATFKLYKYKRFQNQRIFALFCATALSLVAPLSWFFLAKAHSYIHTHINYVLWYMPFAFFALAFVAVSLAEMEKLRGARKGLLIFLVLSILVGPLESIAHIEWSVDQKERALHRAYQMTSSVGYKQITFSHERSAKDESNGGQMIRLPWRTKYVVALQMTDVICNNDGERWQVINYQILESEKSIEVMLDHSWPANQPGEGYLLLP